MQINKELRINVIQLNVCDSHTVVLMALAATMILVFFYFIFGWQSLCAMRAMRVHSDNDEENTLGRVIHAMIGSWWVPAVGHSEHELMALYWKMADDGRWVGGFVESVVRLIEATFESGMLPVDQLQSLDICNFAIDFHLLVVALRLNGAPCVCRRLTLRLLLPAWPFVDCAY